jgi:RHS repeat-associated protein
VRHKAFGATRFTSGTTPTTFRYTGQREESGLGLYYYGARWYDPALGHFIQPDTLIPNPGNVLDYHRYAYVRYNPLKYNDPTGHYACAAASVCLGPAELTQALRAVQEGARAAGPYAGPVATVGTLAVATGAGGVYAIQWAIEDNGPDYTVPVEYQADTIQTSYVLPGSYTIQSSLSGNGQLGIVQSSSQEAEEKPSTLKPGPYAGESIPARSGDTDFTNEERQEIDRIGSETGCHTCGTKDPGTKSGHFIPDHQPSTALNVNNQPQSLYPHCLACSRRQGGEVRETLRLRGPR